MFTSLCITLSLNRGKTCDLLPINKRWQRWWNVTPMITLSYRRLRLIQRPTLSGLEEASSHVMRDGDISIEKTKWQGTAGGPRGWKKPLSDSLQEIEAPSLIASRKRILPTTQVNLKEDASSVESSDENIVQQTLWLQPQLRTQLCWAWIPEPQSPWGNKYGLL